VSVIINCYNSAAYLKEALESVLSQTFSDWEVIFWDNQSSDESSIIFNSYSDKRFHYYLAPEHTVLGEARNLAVEKACGEWLAFLDCDDVWLPEKLHKQVSIILEESDNLGLVYGFSQVLLEEGNELNTAWVRTMRSSNKKKLSRQHLPEGNIFSKLLKENFVPLVSGVVSRSAYWQVGGIKPELKQAEDYDLFIKISKDFKVRAVQEIVCNYRVHQLNMTHSHLETNYKESISLVSKYLPIDSAKKGLQSHQNAYAVHEIRMGSIFGGLKRILFHGNLLILISIILKKLSILLSFKK
jgi:glycosyltransferase involved in cell wall biosynthesis